MEQRKLAMQLCNRVAWIKMENIVVRKYCHDLSLLSTKVLGVRYRNLTLHRNSGLLCALCNAQGTWTVQPRYTWVLWRFPKCLASLLVIHKLSAHADLVAYITGSLCELFLFYPQIGGISFLVCERRVMGSNRSTGQYLTSPFWIS